MKLRDPEISVSLSVAIMLICIACLRQDPVLALKHIDGGLKLLERWREKFRRLGPSASAGAESDFVENTARPMMAWPNMATGIPGRPSVMALAVDS
jgi:hypothetical protein